MGSRYSQPRIYSKRLRNGSRACGIRTADIASASYVSPFRPKSDRGTSFSDDNPLIRSRPPFFPPFFPRCLCSLFFFLSLFSSCIVLASPRDTGARGSIHLDAWHGKFLSFSFFFFWNFISVIVTSYEQIASLCANFRNESTLDFFVFVSEEKFTLHRMIIPILSNLFWKC